MHRRTWTVLAVAVAFFLLLNLHPWDQGVGGSGPQQPPGTNFEGYFGWPACYRAEWWKSDDPALMMRILSRAPFYSPSREMTLHVR